MLCLVIIDLSLAYPHCGNYLSCIAELLYVYLDSKDLFLVEQKGCRQACCGTKDHLFVDKMILREAKMKHKNLQIVWIDYRKAYNSIPHAWILTTVP